MPIGCSHGMATPALAASAPPVWADSANADWPIRAVTLSCIVLALGTLALPVALVHLPPLLDYPNHLARMWLLAGGVNVPPLNAIYAVDWSGASTNIGVDLLAATVGRWVGAEVLAKLLLAAAILLPPLGAVLLNRSVFGGWHWWQAGFPVLAWNATLLAGFLNFQIGLGLALIAAYADSWTVRCLGPRWATPIRIVLGGALLVFHAFAAGFYGVLLAGLAFGSGRQPFSSTALFGHAARRVAAVVGMSVGVPVACLMLLAPRLPGSHAPPGVYNVWEGFTFNNKLSSVLSAITTYDSRLDLAAIFLLCAIARIFASGPLLRCHAGLMLGALGLLLVTVLIPSTLGGTAFVDWRFSIMAVLTAVAALRPSFQLTRASGMAAVALAGLALARTGWIGSTWQERQADVAAVEQVLALVPPGAAVLPTEHTRQAGQDLSRGRALANGLPWHLHLPSLAVPLRHAFVPTLFTAPGKQPLRVLPPWTSISVLEGVPAPVPLLWSYTPTPWMSYAVGYVADWRKRFDYVLVLDAQVTVDGDEASLPELEPVADRGFARLYRIKR